ncbi:MAG TPA: Hsp20/alpha crystallin family protein [Jiangellales bacterium]|jgi:HSP20 family protein|nr:Hsp20/alpha crystallin family protein [Jiangellales bacterium]
MAEVAKRREGGGWPELLDWFERGMPTMFRGQGQGQWPGTAIRVEDYVEEDAYVLRAELPGIDPEKDVEVTVTEGVLDIRAERREEHKEGGRSEFRYGSFERSVTLPPTANEDDVTATYADGILTVRVGLGEQPKTEARRIEIRKS